MSRKTYLQEYLPQYKFFVTTYYNFYITEQIKSYPQIPIAVHTAFHPSTIFYNKIIRLQLLRKYNQKFQIIYWLNHKHVYRKEFLKQQIIFVKALA